MSCFADLSSSVALAFVEQDALGMAIASLDVEKPQVVRGSVGEGLLQAVRGRPTEDHA